MGESILAGAIRVGLGLFGGIYFLAPWPLKRALARGLGWIFRLLSLRRTVIDSNLKTAGMAPSDQLLNEAYAHLGFLTFEFLMLFCGMRWFVKRKVTLTGYDHVRRAQREGKGVFFLSSHVGNWEVMAAAGAVLEGCPLMLVTKRLKPAAFHQAVEKARERCGVSGTYEPQTLRDVFRALKSNAVVGFVLDQYAGAPVGVRVPFLGVPVGTSNALATLVKRTGAAVVPVVNYRLADGNWRVEIEPALSWVSDADPHRELALNTAHYAKVIEAHVRLHPEQWLWTHRRFKGDLSPLRNDEWTQPRARQ